MRSGTNIDVIKACDGADNGCVRDLAVRVSLKSGPGEPELSPRRRRVAIARTCFDPATAL